MKRIAKNVVIVAALLLCACNQTDNNIDVDTDFISNTQTTTYTAFIQSSETDTENIVETSTAENTTKSGISEEQSVTTTTTLTETQTTTSATTKQSQTEKTTTVTTELEEDDNAVKPDNWSVNENTTPNGSTIYNDTKRYEKYILINVTPQKIYWNEIEGYDITEGQPMDIPIPVVFDDFLANADELMIYMTEAGRRFGNVSLDDGNTLKGMIYPQNWAVDHLCPIKDGKVKLIEFTEEMGNFFRLTSSPYVEEANYHYSDNPFEDNMSVSNLDLYFETIKKDYDALMKEMEENPNSAYDIAGFWGYQDGVRFRATINYIH